MNKGSQKKFIIFLFGSLAAALGSGMTAFAMGIYVFQKTGLASSKSFISLFSFLPTVLLSPLAGVLADKYDRRKLMILADGLSGLGILLILLSNIFGFESYPIICLGLFISAVFSSMIEPASRATITDIVGEDMYTKASGLVQLVGASRFLLAPILSSLILTNLGLKAILIIDILTLFLTIFANSLVARGLDTKEYRNEDSIKDGFLRGLQEIKTNQGLYQMILLSCLLTFAMGFIQELSSPMLLSFTSPNKLSLAITISAIGMLVSSILLGIFKLKGDHIKIFAISLFFSGLFMATFGLRENLILITISGFLFFASLPLLNANLDYLVRVNTPNALQGRIWGIIGILSQMGYIIAYAIAGPLADLIFTPLLLEKGALASSIGKLIGTGSSRGMGFMIILAGLILSLSSIFVIHSKEIRALNKKEN